MYKQVALILLYLALLPASAFGQVTFAKDVAPVVFTKCAQCHHPGGSAPFSLLTYAEARSHATQIALVARNRVMPPWKADPAGHKFIGLDPLTDAEIAHPRALGRGRRARRRSSRLARASALDRRLAARHTRSRRDAADAVRPSSRRPGRLARVRPAAARRSTTLRARHRVPRQQPADPSREHPHRRHASVARARRAGRSARLRRHHPAVGGVSGWAFPRMDSGPGRSPSARRARVDARAEERPRRAAAPRAKRKTGADSTIHRRCISPTIRQRGHR